jgi:pyrimidine-nucleoside phosphorylase
MEQPLGRTVGNALEVRESVECLRGAGPADLREITLALAVECVVAVEGGSTASEVRASLEAMLDDGRALARFVRLVEAQGGDPAFIERAELLPTAPFRLVWESPVDGIVTRADAYEIGVGTVELGAGRSRMEDGVDPAVGVELFARRGASLRRGEPIAEVHARTEDAAQGMIVRLQAAYEFGEVPPEDLPLVLRRVP